jgi:hypothetical protein
MIKVINKRLNGSLFHYAHFLIDCLYPEIIQDIFTYSEVVREKSIVQTIGNFVNIYTEVMNIKNTEVNKDSFDSLKDTETIVLRNKEEYTHITYLDKFRNFIFSRYKINDLEFLDNFPEIILIKRGERVQLIDDEELKQINTNVTTGRERREIHRIDDLECYLKDKYHDKFEAVYLEHIPFDKQVLYFNNCKTIIGIHGAGIANVLFCKEQTKFIEISFNMYYEWFDIVFRNLNINHIKCNENNFDDIMNCLQNNGI